jgi:cytochrome P450
VSALHAFFLFMTQNPEVQARAQAEIDQVTGGERLPTYDDRERLPYVAALVKEVLRCAAIVPQGGARQIQADDFYEGYLIPKGSIVLANVW